MLPTSSSCLSSRLNLPAWGPGAPARSKEFTGSRLLRSLVVDTIERELTFYIRTEYGPTSFCPGVGRTASLRPWTSEMGGLQNPQKCGPLLRFTGWFQASLIKINNLPGHMWSCQGWWRSSRLRGCRATWCPQSWWTQTSTEKWELQQIVHRLCRSSWAQSHAVGYVSEMLPQE